MTEAKRCPFCQTNMSSFAGANPSSFARGENGSFSVGCDDCGSQGPFKPTMGEAVSAWNTRESSGKPEAVSQPNRISTEDYYTLFPEGGKLVAALRASAVAEPVADYCTSGPPDERKRRWIVLFDDPDKGAMVFDDEAEAHSAWDRAKDNWTCTLFETSERKYIWAAGALRALYTHPAPAAAPTNAPYYHAWLEVMDLCNKLKDENHKLRNAAAPTREPGK